PIMALLLVGVLACGALGASAMAFHAGQTQGYAMGISQGSGEVVAPMPYGGYHRPGLGMGLGLSCLAPFLCGGGLLLALGVPLLIGGAACGGRRRRSWRGPCGSEADEDMPDEVREYMAQRFQGRHPYPPGPWMSHRRPRGHRHGPWTGEDMPDEVKQWFRQQCGSRAPQAPADEPTTPTTDESPAPEPAAAAADAAAAE
ncbi:MAG: hypothetical protein KJ734_01760, partial [Chloroflexi bacterium]|nr:hypothetical protein [Chloroflexota bacterium]